jgi:uncharacterized delta-60 repeat protein
MHRTVSARRLLRLAGAALAVAGLAVPATAAAAPGDPDTSLGSGRGFVTTDVVTNPNVHDAGNAVAVSPFGEVFVAGTSFGGGIQDAASVVKYNCCGVAPDFGSGGKAIFSLDSGAAANDVLYDNRLNKDLNDDRLLVAGSAKLANGNRLPMISALRRSGQFDPSWNANGIQRHAVPGATSAEFLAVTRQSDGRIVGAGKATVNGVERFFVARYTADGRLDPTFSGDGMRTVSTRKNVNGTLVSATSETGNDVAFDAATNRILIAGTSRYPGLASTADELTTVVALNASDGSLDARWDADGVQVLSIANGDDRATAVDLDGSGRALLAGVGDPANGNDPSAYVARLRTDGQLDPAFSGDGRLTYRPGRDVGATDIAVNRANGQITASLFDRGGNTGSDDDDTLTTIRLRPDGTFDSLYGGGDGEVRTNVNPGVGGFEVANAIALRNDGSPVVAGSSSTGTFVFTLAAYRNS